MILKKGLETVFIAVVIDGSDNLIWQLTKIFSHTHLKKVTILVKEYTNITKIFDIQCVILKM